MCLCNPFFVRNCMVLCISGFETQLMWSSKWFDICVSCAFNKAFLRWQQTNIDSIEMVTFYLNQLCVRVESFSFVPFESVLSCSRFSFLFSPILLFSAPFKAVAARYLFQYHAIQTIWIPPLFVPILVGKIRIWFDKVNGIVHTCHIQYVPFEIAVNFLLVHLIFLSNYIWRQCDTCPTVRNESNRKPTMNESKTGKNKSIRFLSANKFQINFNSENDFVIAQPTLLYFVKVDLTFSAEHFCPRISSKILQVIYLNDGYLAL